MYSIYAYVWYKSEYINEKPNNFKNSVEFDFLQQNFV